MPPPKSPAGVARRDPTAPRLHRRTRRLRAADREPRRIRLGRAGPAVGASRCPTIRSAWMGRDKPGGMVKILTDIQRRRPLRPRHDFPRRIALSQRHHALARWRAHFVARPISSLPPRPMATATPTERRVLFTGFKEGNQQHRLEWLRVGPRWLDLWRQWRQRRHGQWREHQRPRFSLSAGQRRVRGGERLHAVRPAPRRLGQLVRQQQLRVALALHVRRTLPAAESAARGEDRPSSRWRIIPTPRASSR